MAVSKSGHCSTNWTMPFTLSHCCIFSFHQYQHWELTANNTVWFRRKGQYFETWRIRHAKKDVYMNMRLILNGYRDWAISDSKRNFVRFFLWIWTQGEVYNRNIIKRDKFLARTVYAAARTEKREDQLRRKRRDIRTRVAKCTEFDGTILEYLLQTATNF